MSAQDLIAAALTAAELIELTDLPVDSVELAQELREACARAMVQPDVSEVERLLTGAMNANFLWGQATIECDGLKHDVERLMQIVSQEVSNG